MSPPHLRREEEVNWRSVSAQTDAMITDPVYEGKSMAGMMQLIREGSIASGSNVLYIHLGGQPALNAYSSYFPHK